MMHHPRLSRRRRSTRRFRPMRSPCDPVGDRAPSASTPCPPSSPTPTSSWPASGSTATTRPAATPASSAASSPSGVTATQDVDALLALDADCICYTAHSDVRPGEVVDDLCRMLASGKNVVNTSFVAAAPPEARPASTTSSRRPARRAARRSSPPASTRATATPASPSAPSALCKEVRSVRMMEIVNYATWDNPFTHVRDHGLREGRRRPGRCSWPRAAPPWPGDRCVALVADVAGPRRWTTIDRAPRGAAGRRGRRDRLGHRRGRDDLGHALRDHRRGRRRGADRRRARHPPPGRRRPATGPRARATGS